ncbi:MAG: hypothetical protein KGM42_16685 [Hyphomicrobiales bacterium]|nr:hypothetical protein [Hyphomicrobiales bacterium]
MGEARIKRQKAKARKADAEARLEKSLVDTFPASDPSQETAPGGGITSTEPPPKGQKTGK